MSGNVPAPTTPTKNQRSRTLDRRVVQTRDALGDALVELMHHKPFDEITVQHVLDRAGVGRSTFYTHYRDKEDLFVSDLEEFLEIMAGLLTATSAPPRRVAPVEELFSHVRDMRALHAALVSSGKMADVNELGRGIFARSIAHRLTLAGVAMQPLEREAHSQALAGSLFALLDWWVARGMAADPAEMDALFHRIVWYGTQPASSSPPSHGGDCLQPDPKDAPSRHARRIPLQA